MPRYPIYKERYIVVVLDGPWEIWSAHETEEDARLEMNRIFSIRIVNHVGIFHLGEHIDRPEKGDC